MNSQKVIVDGQEFEVKSPSETKPVLDTLEEVGDSIADTLKDIGLEEEEMSARSTLKELKKGRVVIGKMKKSGNSILNKIDWMFSKKREITPRYPNK